AIESFRTVNGQYPRELQDLVRDPHSPSRRHLRALYPDPMSAQYGPAQYGPAKSEGGWQLIRAADGGIQGVASRSAEEPLKKANFPKRWQQFEKAKSYREWSFEYVPTAARTLTTTPAAGASAGAGSASLP